jgi:peroxiredoxin
MKVLLGVSSVMGARAARCVLSAALLLASGCGAEAAQGGHAATASAPDFSLQSTEGRTVRLSDYLGKNVVLIDFWSTTCDPCMAEMPHLVELYNQHKDKGFVVLAISLDGPESLAEVNRVVHDKGMVFPVLLDQETTVVARYNPKREMPFSVLIDKTGTIVKKRAGYTPGEEKGVAADVAQALQ